MCGSKGRIMEYGFERLVAALNDRRRTVRLESLRRLMAAVKAGTLDAPKRCDGVNNHIHTTYSFSIYSPAMAVWEAYRAGLRSAGIMDHDSICGAREFIEAGNVVGIATTIGVECRADFSETPLRGRRINNPDQLSNAYISLHGIPHNRITAVKNFFKPLIRARHRRNRAMVDRINMLLLPFSITLSYDFDVLPLSNHCEGGTVTERHLLYALSRRLVLTIGKGRPLIDFLTERLGISVAPEICGRLLDCSAPFYEYDLLGVLKGAFVSSFYVKATDECPHVGRLISFAKECGCISAYAYLGDVEASVTGDKKPQKFEDAYLDELIVIIKKLGFHAVTYMPSRNTPSQLERIMKLCRENNLLEISGEDINSPRQPFVSRAAARGEFLHLSDATWALIGHEKAATAEPCNGFFSAETIRKFPDLAERIRFFRAIGRSTSAVAAAD
ncbi:MAG: PHP domain-containing protein [Chitinispirillaceae bacterium]|nr:PHP domain-containing protein [Chitinispirillaceae bacterium]